MCDIRINNEEGISVFLSGVENYLIIYSTAVNKAGNKIFKHIREMRCCRELSSFRDDLIEVYLTNIKKMNGTIKKATVMFRETIKRFLKDSLTNSINQK